MRNLILILCIGICSASGQFTRRAAVGSQRLGAAAGGSGALATDNFNRANETPLASPWVQSGTAASTFNLSANAVVPGNVSQDTEYIYTGPTWGNDQYSQAKVTVTSTTGGNGGGVGCRMAAHSATMNGFRCVVSHAASANVVVKMWDNSTATTAVGTFTTTWVDGDTLKMSVTGTTPNIVIKVFKNGTQLGSDLTGVGNAGNANLNSGSAGITYSSTSTSASVDDWEGGNYP